jgi:hypothetical protein
MSRTSADLDMVRELALELADVEESTAWGASAFKVGGRLFACEAVHSSAEVGSLMVRIDFDLRTELLATEPDVYYLTPHYEKYPAVLVRLSRSRRGALRKLLGTAHAFVGSQPAARPRKRRKRTRST